MSSRTWREITRPEKRPSSPAPPIDVYLAEKAAPSDLGAQALWGVEVNVGRRALSPVCRAR